MLSLLLHVVTPLFKEYMLADLTTQLQFVKVIKVIFSTSTWRTTLHASTLVTKHLGYQQIAT